MKKNKLEPYWKWRVGGHKKTYGSLLLEAEIEALKPEITIKYLDNAVRDYGRLYKRLAEKCSMQS